MLNLAARAGVRYSMENPHVYLSTNAEGTLTFWNACVKTDAKKFVLASTSSLYAGQKMPFTEDLSVNEPLSPYAASKKAGELMAYSYHKLYEDGCLGGSLFYSIWSRRKPGYEYL